MKETNDLKANHRPDRKILGASDTSPSTNAIVGFPMRATRDSELSLEDLRILICVGVLADSSGSCDEDTRWIARQTDLPEPIVVERLDRLGARGYVRRDRQGRVAVLSLVPDPDAARPSATDDSGAAPARRSGRSTQARLHGDLLRRRKGRPVGSIERRIQ